MSIPPLKEPEPIWTIAKIGGFIGILITVCVFSYDKGQDNAVAKYERETTAHIDEMKLCAENLERTQIRIKRDSLERDNWMEQNLTNILINSENNSMPTLTVSNNTINPCEGGKITGCWQQETNARHGDVIAFQIYFHNTGELKIDDVSIAFNSKYNKTRTSRTANAGIFVGNKLIVEDVANVYFKSPSAISYIPGSGSFRLPNSNLDHLIDDSSLFIGTGVKMGRLDTSFHGNGCAVFQFAVEKANNQ